MPFRPATIGWLFSAQLCLLLTVSCARKPAPSVVRPDFCADSAYTYVADQVALGPRVPGSEEHTQAILYLINKLQSFGAEPELQQGVKRNYAGERQAIYNIIGHFGSPSPDKERILLCAHYDSRPWCDQEDNYDDRFQALPAANDGASGVAVLLEVARQIGLRQKCLNDSINDQMVNEKMVNVPVDIVFLDCEDMGTPAFYTGSQREHTWCLGSQLFAEHYAHQTAVRYRFGIVLDMVGDPMATFPKEYYSTQYAESYQQKIWRDANRLGYGQLFVNKPSLPIIDDHFYLNYIGGIPTVDIIHYNTGFETGFAPWWHTRNDDMTNISTQTLQAVGEVIMSQIN